MKRRQKVRVGTVKVPDELAEAHTLCFLLHDVLVEALRSGEEHGIFYSKVALSDENDRRQLDEASDIFAWLEATGRESDRGRILSGVVLQALLSDSLLCFYDALKASERGRLSTTFMLVRKPLQESLFLFELMLIDPSEFGSLLASNPMKLRAGKVGGPEAHRVRIKRVLGIIQDSRFDAQYISTLRYDKTSEDSFDGICNQAMHLFTEHRAIRTSELNINFIFSSPEARLSQWRFLYSRLPYLLTYFSIVVECLMGRMAQTDPQYMESINRRICAQICL